MTGPQVIVLATPVFLLLIGIEFLIGWRRGRNTYRLADALNSIGLGVMSQIVGVFSVLLMVGIYAFFYDHVALWKFSPAEPWVWVAALVAYDFCYYWKHRFGHTVALMWAAHVVHHQSEDYNLSTALRQPGTGWVVDWAFYLPMAVLGFPPLVFGIVGLVQLLYQFWPHTQQIGTMGWFDRWFCSPSNHRVHHAVNDKYLDRNYGGIFMVWDRLFGTFQLEDADVPCVYGTRGPLRSWNPLWANLHNYADMARDSRQAGVWADKLRVWFKHPGWRPADVARRWPKPAFDIARVERFDPPMTDGAQWLAMLLFVMALNATTLFLWFAHQLSLAQQAGAAALILALLWAVGRVCESGSVFSRETALRGLQSKQE